MKNGLLRVRALFAQAKNWLLNKRPHFVRSGLKTITRPADYTKKTWVIIGGVVVVLMTIQFLYPADRAVPFARIGHQLTLFDTKKSIEQKLDTAYTQLPITLTIRGKSETTTLHAAGIEPDKAAVVRAVTDYPMWMRIIPLSLLVKGIFTDRAVTPTFHSARFSQYGTDVEKPVSHLRKMQVLSCAETLLSLTMLQRGRRVRKTT